MIIRQWSSIRKDKLTNGFIIYTNKGRSWFDRWKYVDGTPYPSDTYFKQNPNYFNTTFILRIIL